MRRWNNADVARWIRSYWDDEDVTFLWEVDDNGWITRSVELVGPERRVQAAAALDEVTRARDSSGISAVRAYEVRYGVAPEKPIDDWGFPHENISQSEFDQVWAESRRALEP